MLQCFAHTFDLRCVEVSRYSEVGVEVEQEMAVDPHRFEERSDVLLLVFEVVSRKELVFDALKGLLDGGAAVRERVVRQKS